MPLSIYIICILGVPSFPIAQDKIVQETHGNQASAAYSKYGNVTIIYQNLSEEERELIFHQLKNNQQLIDRLIKENDRLTKENETLKANRVKREAEIHKFVREYAELRNSIIKLSQSNEQDNKIKEAAKAALIKGDLSKARGTMAVYSPHGIKAGYSPNGTRIGKSP
ncbi:MAG: hypothetical protein C4519_11370 [Desulfobacteraceae bacterium]|nr:MAG: hypothetical protein C4519_11370 [Desulfobacteraceae bacterium]